jgi:hypothetical protein
MSNYILIKTDNQMRLTTVGRLDGLLVGLSPEDFIMYVRFDLRMNMQTNIWYKLDTYLVLKTRMGDMIHQLWVWTKQMAPNWG